MATRFMLERDLSGGGGEFDHSVKGEYRSEGEGLWGWRQYLGILHGVGEG